MDINTCVDNHDIHDKISSWLLLDWAYYRHSNASTVFFSRTGAPMVVTWFEYQRKWAVAIGHPFVTDRDREMLVNDDILTNEAN